VLGPISVLEGSVKAEFFFFTSSKAQLSGLMMKILKNSAPINTGHVADTLLCIDKELR
jgi:hypothetical protein